MNFHTLFNHIWTNLLTRDAGWSTLPLGYPKWKVDVDNGKFPSVKIRRFVSSRSQKDTLGVTALDMDLHKTNNFAPNEYRGVVNSSGLVVYKGSMQDIETY